MYISTCSELLSLATLSKRSVLFSEDSPSGFGLWFLVQRHKDWYGHGFRGLVSFCTAYYFGALKTLPLILLQTSYWSVLLRMARGAEGWQPPTAQSWNPQKCFSTEQVYADTYWLPLCAMFFHSVVQFGLVKVKNLTSMLIIQHNGPWMLFLFALVTTQNMVSLSWNESLKKIDFMSLAALAAMW